MPDTIVTNVLSTTDYGKFDPHFINRPIGPRPQMESLMDEHGFLASSAIHVVETSKGRLGIVRGHHRYHYAKAHGLPIYYIIDDAVTDIHVLESSKHQDWSLRDWLDSQIRAGNEDCIAVKNYMDRTGFPLVTSLNLCFGQSAGSNAAPDYLREGKFRLGDQTHAEQVAAVVERLRELGPKFPFLQRQAFVAALSSLLRVPEFNEDRFVAVVKKSSMQFTAQRNTSDYLYMITSLYNHHLRKMTRITPDRVDEVMRERSATANPGDYTK
jgi:hypothetical protein